MVNGRNNRRQRNNLGRQMALLKSSLHGHPNRLRHLAPPGYSLRPFNNIVVGHVQVDASTEYFYGPRDVIRYLINQLGLVDQDQTQITFKMRRIDVYATAVAASAGRPSIGLAVGSLTPTVADPATPAAADVSYGLLFNQTDTGTLSESAKLSYTFPRSMSDIPISYGSDYNFAACSANVPNVEVRFHIEWSTIGQSVPTD